jgi:hypothetical protein
MRIDEPRRVATPRSYLMCRPAHTALCVLGSSTAMYYPAAFDDAGRALLSSVFEEPIEAKDEDAEALGLNAVSDGYHGGDGGAGDRAGTAAGRARIQAGSRGHAGTAQSPRRREVLHARTAPTGQYSGY